MKQELTKEQKARRMLHIKRLQEPSKYPKPEEVMPKLEEIEKQNHYPGNTPAKKEPPTP